MIYEEYENLIAQQARKHGQTTSEIENMMEVGMEAFVIATRKYDPAQGAAFSTFLRRVLKNSMVDEYRRTKRHHESQHLSFEKLTDDVSDGISYASDYLPIDVTKDPAKIVEFIDEMNHLGEESREIIKIILSSPSDILDISKSLAPKYLRASLKIILRNKGFKWASIKIGVQEIKKGLEATA